MVFVCNRCGICCKGLRGVHNPRKDRLEEAKIAVQQKNNSGPVYFFVNPEDITFMMFEHEIEPLRKAANDRGVELKIKPHRAFYDDYGKTWVVLTWFLDHDDCPFLTNEGCSVYNIRPLACRSFPVHSPSIIRETNINGRGDISDVLGNCPLIDEKSYDGKKLGDILSDFGECAVAARTMDFFFQYENDMISPLVARSMLIKVHRGRMPTDREHYQPAIKYLSALGILSGPNLDILNHVDEIVKDLGKHKNTTSE